MGCTMYRNILYISSDFVHPTFLTTSYAVITVKPLSKVTLQMMPEGQKNKYVLESSYQTC